MPNRIILQRHNPRARCPYVPLARIQHTPAGSCHLTDLVFNYHRLTLFHDESARTNVHLILDRAELWVLGFELDLHN